MFTGIIEEKGIVRAVTSKKNLGELNIATRKIARGIRIGESVAINGTCLTVTKKTGKILAFDIMKETLARTTLKNLQSGDPVNLERALKFGQRLGGHFVTGHIDGAGTVKSIIKRPNYVEMIISISKDLIRYVLPKGSVSVEGISLTVGSVRQNTFSIYLIPHTLKVTTLGTKKPGDKVNIETDILMKCVLRKNKGKGILPARMRRK